MSPALNSYFVVSWLIVRPCGRRHPAAGLEAALPVKGSLARIAFCGLTNRLCRSFWCSAVEHSISDSLTRGVGVPWAFDQMVSIDCAGLCRPTPRTGQIKWVDLAPCGHTFL